MKYFLQRHRLLPLTVSLGCVATVGLAQPFASARAVAESAPTAEFAAQPVQVARSMRPLTKVLAELERNHQVIFDFDSDVVKSKSVNVAGLDTKTANLERVLFEVLTPLNLTFEKFNSRSYLIYSRQNKPATRPAPVRASAAQEGKQPLGTLPGIAAPNMLTASLTDRTVRWSIGSLQGRSQKRATRCRA
jgi:TonB-dependent starch-binding outer membrane protein SusC